jgi:thioredoxin 1
MTLGYEEEQPDRADIDATTGPVALEFGANWCGICRAARPRIDEALGERPDVRRIKVADGPGRALGRSFGIKLWPTLVLLDDGDEVGRLVRPRSREEIDEALTEAYG